jgi:hypothetical protein
MRRTLAVSLLALVCSTAVYAQAVIGSGAVTGLIKDRFGDGIPDTTITLTNKVLGVTRVMMTSDSGVFDAPGLVPAPAYSLKVTRRGYGDWELASFDVSVGETLNFKITLYADKAATPIEAQRSLASVQDSKTSITTLVTGDQLVELPMDGRLLDKLILLAPELTEGGDGVLAFRAEAYTNAFDFDGINTTNTFFLRRPGIAPFLSPESVAEMQVISTAATAEFGHSMVGMVNLVTKPGTNDLHAAAYDYYNDNSWNSADPFGHGFVPTGRRNLGGASIGLPVSSDSLFLFGDLERTNDSSQGLNRITNPLFTDPAGNTVVTTGCAATAAQCAAAAGFIDSQMNVKVPMSQIATSGFMRVDVRPNQHEHFSVAGAILSKRGVNEADNATVDTHGGLLGSNANLTDSFRYGMLAWTHVMDMHAVNELRGFWLRDTITAATDSSLYPASTPSCLACGTGPLGITVAGTSLGGNPAYPFNQREERFGGTDSFTKTAGNHTIKGGADITHTQDTMSQLYARFGQYNYNSFSAFATDFTADVKGLKDYATFVQTLGTSSTNLPSWGFHLYAEDTWKVFPGFVFSAGLRWEKERLPQPTEPNPEAYLSAFIPSPNTNFNPRIGFAYMIDKRTVVRAGGGTYYQPFPGQLIRDLFAGGAIYQSSFELPPSAVGGTVFPNVQPSTAVNTLSTVYFGLFYAAQRFRNPYTEQGTLAIERRMNRYVSLAANIVLSQGVKLWTATDQNLPGSTTTSENYVIENAQGAVVNNYDALVWNKAIAGHKYQVDTEGASRYRGATAQLRTAPLFGLTVQASYTWSLATDDVSGPPAYSIVPANFFPGDYNGDQGHSSFDQRNRAVVNWTWQPVVSKKNDALSRFLLNGWTVSGIATYASSMSTTPLVEVLGQQFSGVTMDYTNSLLGSGGWSRVPFEGVNTVPIGVHANVDLRVSRSLPLSQRLKGRLMFEVYNATNHQNNTSVNTIAYTAVSSILTPAPGLGIPTGDYSYPTGSAARHIQVAFRLDF